MPDYPALSVHAPTLQDNLVPLSTMLGIKGKMIANKRAQAEMEQSQQQNSELQQAQALVHEAARPGSKYDDGKGGFDRQSMADDIARIGPYAQQMAGQLLSQAQTAATTRATHQKLSTDQNQQIAGIYKGIAGMDNPTGDDVRKAFVQAVVNNKDPDFVNAAANSLMNFRPEWGPQEIKQRAANAASYTEGFTQVASDKNAAGQTINRNTLTGKLSPAQTSGSAPSSGTGNSGTGLGLNPTSTQVTRATTGSTGEVQSDTDRFSRVMTSAANAQSGIALADQVGALAKQVRTGKLTKEWADKLTVLQQHDPNITSRQMLGKYAAQLQTLAEGNAASDAERAQIHSGMPDPNTMDPDAVRKASQYLHGYFAMAKDRGKNLSAHVGKTGGVQGATVNDTQFSGQRDPLVYAFRDMPRDDQREFLLERFGSGKSQALDDFERRVNGNQ